MAKCYLPPEHIKAPELDVSISIEEQQKKEERFLGALRVYCSAKSMCPDAGKIVGFPVGDGRAWYMIYGYDKLILLQIGDRWEITDAHMRGLRAADVKQLANRRSFADLKG